MPQQLVNPDSALDNAGSDQTLVRDLADVFVSSADQLLNDLQAAYAAGDHECLARAAHTLKSPLGFFGADETLILARTVEQLADDGSEDGLPELIDRLVQDVRQVRTELEALSV